MKIRASIEMAQDIHSNMSLIRGLSRNPITDEEIAHWQALYARTEEHYVIGARIKTEDFSEAELAMYARVYERYPAGMIIRTPDFTEEEVKDWQVWYWKINKMDLQEIKKKVQFFGSDDPPPYEEAF